MKDLIGLSKGELADEMASIGEKPFRAKQLWQWIYFHGVTDFAKMSNLSKQLRDKLQQNYFISRPKIVTEQLSSDGTHKWLLEFADGERIETVYIPEEEGQALAFDGSLEALDAVENTQGVTIVNDVITTDQDIYFNIDVENGKLQSASGLYIGVPSNNNALKVAVDEGTYSNSFAIAEDGSAAIEAVFDGSLMSLRFNDASNQMRFRYYKNNGQKAIYLFKAVGE